MTASATDTRFWNRVARKYAARPISDEAAYQRKLEITRGYMRPNDRVLELGCGTGGTALAHAPFVAEIRATDIAPKMIEIAREQAAAAGIDTVRFETVAVEDIDVAGDSLDMVLALNLLHLLSDPQAALAQIFNWLKPGGLVVAGTACIDDALPIFRVIGPPMRWVGLAPRVTCFSRAKLEAMYRAEGFDIEEHWQPPGRLSALFTVARKPA